MTDRSTESMTGGAQTDEARGSYPVLTVAHHPDPSVIGARLVLAGDRELVLGRSAGNALGPALDEGKVSRRHAVVQAGSDGWAIEDCGSRNGTRVNGERIAKRVLAMGDVVQVGRVLLLHHRGPLTYTPPRHPELWGFSHSLGNTLEAASVVAEGEANVAIVGETGCGKDLLARHIHEKSGVGGSFVPVNCGGLAPGVLQSQLFGHLRGAFSGADATRAGLVREAEGGTLFLDEVVAAPEEMQSTLLRLLESKEYRVVGGRELVRANVRFICAVPPGVDTLISGHRFRSDLWFRLTQRIVRVAALRDRREDIPLLALRFARRVRDEAVTLTSDFAHALLRYGWPGNVRQLRSFAERMALDQRGRDQLVLQPEHLAELRIDERPGPVVRHKPSRGERHVDPGRHALDDALTRAMGNVTHAARALGVPRKTLYRWIDAHQIDVTSFRAGAGDTPE